MQTKKTIIRRAYQNHHAVEELTTGATTRNCTEIILYDERGPWITNYTNGNKYEFETIRPIGVKALEAPDWSNPNGFIIREKGTFRARLHNCAVYLLFVHLDNLKPYAREFLDYWSMCRAGYDEGTAIECTFSYEGCTFFRGVHNPRINEAVEAVNMVLEQYEGDNCSILNNYLHALNNPGEVKAFCKHFADAVDFYEETVDEVKSECGIFELIRTNGANQPIGPNDYYNLQHHFPDLLKNTYRLEPCPRTAADIWND